VNRSMCYSGAAFSEDRTYRYMLARAWDPNLSSCAAFVGLNPSTADENVDDATVRRLMGFARSWGYGALVLVNLFAFRATDPRAMRRASDPIGVDNDRHILKYAGDASIVVACWGAHGSHLGRNAAVAKLLKDRPIFALRETKTGEPMHPLYLPAHLRPQFWQVPLTMTVAPVTPATRPG
jgi:hypothetical protein